MEWVVKKLKSEVSVWNDYKERVRAWQCNTEMDTNAKITEIERRNAELINKTLDLRCPCTEIEKEEVLGVHLQSCTQAWAEARGCPRSSVFQVFWIDFTIPGYHFNRSALLSWSTMSVTMASNPENTVGIILAPNTGPFGNEYTSEGVRLGCRGQSAL